MNINALDFEGDLLLRMTEDGGEVIERDGLFIAERGFGSGVFISFLGGNENDSGSDADRSLTWWGNAMKDLPKDERVVSRFQHVIRSMPMTAKNIQVALTAARNDLAWMIETDVLDSIELEASQVQKNQFRLIVTCLKDSIQLYRNEYGVNWAAMRVREQES